MAMVRPIFVLIASGLVLLLTLQNTSVTLPLIFLGGRFPVLPVGVWLLGAIALGALTTLLLNLLLGINRRPGRSGAEDRYRYSPQGFYEPSPGPTTAPPPSSDQGDWQSWSTPQPTQWESWESRDQPSRATEPPGSPPPRARSWFGRSDRSDADQTWRLEQSLEELSSDWGDLERRRHYTTGASPVQDSLEEITAGWDDLESTPATGEFEAPQSPRQVYRDGSIYSYRYGDRPGAGQSDRIYAPPDQQADRASASPPQSTDAPETEDAGVVDADYRVIIPPYPAPDSQDRQDHPDRSP